jgi:hypothetical protein
LLGWWDTRVAATGLAAAAATPALLATLDQHSAAVRDALLVDTAQDPVAAMEALVLGAAGLIMAPPLAHLAAYLRGVLDQARANGWRPPEEPYAHDWASCADWVSLRITAICALARAHPVRSQPEPPAAALGEA